MKEKKPVSRKKPRELNITVECGPGTAEVMARLIVQFRREKEIRDAKQNENISTSLAQG